MKDKFSSYSYLRYNIILKICILEYLKMIQCRCVEMLYGELQTRAMKCLMGAIIKGFPA